MTFNPGQMAVFDRTGARIGTISTFSVTTPRSYSFNEIENFAFNIPYKDATGNIYDAAMAALLKRDNHIYIANEIIAMPGWGGVISNVAEGNDKVEVTCLGGLSLFDSLQTTLLHQSGGTSSMLATRLVAAAAAKQGAHGDLVPTLQIDSDTNLPGVYDLEGDILQALRRLASDGLAEMYAEAILGSGAASIAYKLHWGAAVASVDHTATVIHDGPVGPNPQLASSPKYLFSGLEVINHAVFHGQPTTLGTFTDYSSVKNVIRDITPEIEVTLDDPAYANYRRREDLTLSVNFGYPEVLQRAMAQDIQQAYVDYFKTFLYAYHQRQGKPFLPGFDWAGPDGTNEKSLTETDFRTLNKLGRIGAATVITADSGAGIATAAITDWAIDTTVTPVGFVSGVALNYADTSQHYIADSSNGQIVLIDDTYTVIQTLVTAAFGSDVLVGIATDAGSLGTIWAAVRNAGGTSLTIKTYDLTSATLLASYTFAIGNATDIAVDYGAGLLYVATTDSGGQIAVRDLSSGATLSPDPSIAAGFAAPVGLTISGGIAYVADASGAIRMLYTATGNLAGTFGTGVPISGGMYADLFNQRVFLSTGSGSLGIYHAYIAVATVGAPGSVSGAPGFDAIIAGQFVHIVESSDHAYNPKTTAGAGASYTVKGGDTLWGIALAHYGSGSSWPTIYKANKATIDSTAQAHGFTSDFPHWIFPGEALTIPGVGGTTNPAPAAPLTRYLTVHTPGRWTTEIVPGPIGEPAFIQRSWDTDPQVVGFTTSAVCAIQSALCVIQGEEGRVNDWSPTLDGYGVYRDSQQYRTKVGHLKEEGAGWYPADWDVPESNWTVPQQPWPEGVAYLNDYLKKRNREITVQSFDVDNAGDLWQEVQRGALFTLQSALQGPVDIGRTTVIRVLAFSPNEATGKMAVIAEEWVP